MRPVAIRATLISLAVGAALSAVAGGANASQVSIGISAPEQAAVGDRIEVSATLQSTDDGRPLADTPVIFYTRGSIGGVTSDVELGRAVTDGEGIATLSYQARAAGEREIRVEYLAPGESEPQFASATISVTGAPQLHRSVSGVQIPVLNSWLIIGVMTTVWSILFFVALRTIAIAGAGSETWPKDGRSRGNPLGPPTAGRGNGMGFHHD